MEEMEDTSDLKAASSHISKGNEITDEDHPGDVAPHLNFKSTENENMSSPESQPSTSKSISMEEKIPSRDDSGICDEDDDSVNLDNSVKRKKKKFKSTDDSNESDPSSADSGLHGSSNNSTDLMPAELDDDDEDTNQINSDHTYTVSPSPRGRISEDSSSSDFSTSDNEFEECDDDASLDNKIFDPVKDQSLLEFLSDNPTKHKYAWHAAKEVSARQYGVSSRYVTDFFKNRYHGSRHAVERLELMYKMKSHTGCVNSLNFNTNGTRLASGSDDLDIVIWDWAIGEPILKFQSGHLGNVFQSKFLPMSGDCHIVSCSRDGQVRLAELSSTGTCKGTRKVAQHGGSAHKLTIRPDYSQIVLSCGEDGVVFEIDLRENQPHKLLMCKDASSKVPLYTINSNPLKPEEFIIGGRDPYVRIYDTRFVNDEGYTARKLCPNHLISNSDKDVANVTCCVYNYNGREILASYNDEDIYLFNAVNSTEDDSLGFLKRYQGHRNSKTVKGVNFFGPESQFVVSGSDCGNIYYWDKETTRIVQCMMGDEGGVVNCLEAHPNIPVIATSGLDDDIKIWISSNENSPDLKCFRRVIRKNRRIQKSDKNSDERKIHMDSRMFWLILRRLQRHGASGLHNFPEETDRIDTSGSDDNYDSDGPSSSQCVQS